MSGGLEVSFSIELFGIIARPHISHWVGGNRKRYQQSTNAEKSIETVFSIAICRQCVDKWQSKTLFLSIFYLRSSMVLCFRLPPTRCVYIRPRLEPRFCITTVPENLIYLVTRPNYSKTCLKRLLKRPNIGFQDRLSLNEGNKVTTPQLDITNENQAVSPFPASDHKALKTDK